MAKTINSARDPPTNTRPHRSCVDFILRTWPPATIRCRQPHLWFCPFSVASPSVSSGPQQSPLGPRRRCLCACRMPFGRLGPGLGESFFCLRSAQYFFILTLTERRSAAVICRARDQCHPVKLLECDRRRADPEMPGVVDSSRFQAARVEPLRPLWQAISCRSSSGDDSGRRCPGNGADGTFTVMHRRCERSPRSDCVIRSPDKGNV